MANLKKGDKGMWVLYSSIVSEFKGEEFKITRNDIKS